MERPNRTQDVKNNFRPPLRLRVGYLHGPVIQAVCTLGFISVRRTRAPHSPIQQITRRPRRNERSSVARVTGWGWRAAAAVGERAGGRSLVRAGAGPPCASQSSGDGGGGGGGGADQPPASARTPSGNNNRRSGQPTRHILWRSGWEEAPRSTADYNVCTSLPRVITVRSPRAPIRLALVTCAPRRAPRRARADSAAGPGTASPRRTLAPIRQRC